MSAPSDTQEPLWAYPVAVPTTAAAGFSPQAGDSLLTGWSFRETTGAASAVVDIYDGNDATGTLVASIALAASESTRDLMGGIPLHIRTGVFVNVVAGSVKGSVWLVDV